MKEVETFSLGSKINESLAKKGPPPVVLAVQPDGHFVLDKPEQLKQWEKDVRTHLGLRMSSISGSATESCSCGCSDDSDLC